jgi:hypothetical protein
LIPTAALDDQWRPRKKRHKKATFFFPRPITQALVIKSRLRTFTKKVNFVLPETYPRPSTRLRKTQWRWTDRVGVDLQGPAHQQISGGATIIFLVSIKVFNMEKKIKPFYDLFELSLLRNV